MPPELQGRSLLSSLKEHINLRVYFQFYLFSKQKYYSQETKDPAKPHHQEQRGGEEREEEEA